jgi:hypothetical protein
MSPLFLGLFWSALVGIVLVGGVAYVKTRDQAWRDKNRRTYKLAFPADLSADQVNAWLQSISGTLKSSPLHLFSVPNIAFEVWATDRGLTHRMRVPWTHADYIIAQLRSLVPGIRVTPEDDEPKHNWTKAVELGETTPSRLLRIPNLEATAASLLASMQALESGEAVIYQWVVIPAVPEKPPEDRARSRSNHWIVELMSAPEASRSEIKDRRKKLGEPNVLAVVRVAAKAKSKERAGHLIYRVRAALASVRSPHNRLAKRIVLENGVKERIAKGAGLLVYPAQLASSELTALLGWPIGQPHVAGLPQGHARHLPPTEAIPRTGRVMAMGNFPGAERPLALSHEDACKHVHVIGPTGTGKTTLLANLIGQDMAAGYGVILIESKGDLFHAAMQAVPKERLDDVIVLDATETYRQVGYNVLAEGNPRVVVDELVGLFTNLYEDSKAVWTRQVLYHALLTLTSQPGYTFVDLAPLLMPMTDEEGAWRDDLIGSVKDRELRDYWKRFFAQPRGAQDRIVQPVMDRIWQLNGRPEIRNIIGQSKSSFTMREVIENNRILLINLADVGADTASLTGTLLMNSLWGAARATRGSRPNFLYMDEFQDFIKLPISPEDLLAKARSFGLGAVFAHQHLDQLAADLRNAVLANARTKVVFQTSAKDASTLSREFGDAVSDSDFMNLGTHEVIMRIATGTSVSRPVTGVSLPPARPVISTSAVRTRSRDQHGRAVNDIEAEIAARRSVRMEPKRKRPVIGEQEW